MEQADRKGQNDKSVGYPGITIDDLLADEPCIMVVPAFYILTKNAEAAIIMSFLERKFRENPNGFYMFYEPCPGEPSYQRGNSWNEVLYSWKLDDLKLVFDKIGVRYGSHKEFVEEKNKFKNKYYCSYYDKNTKQVHYLRNNEVADRAIDSAINTYHSE
jgi:hypothetical protein